MKVWKCDCTSSHSTSTSPPRLTITTLPPRSPPHRRFRHDQTAAPPALPPLDCPPSMDTESRSPTHSKSPASTVHIMPRACRATTDTVCRSRSAKCKVTATSHVCGVGGWVEGGRWEPDEDREGQLAPGRANSNVADHANQERERRRGRGGAPLQTRRIACGNRPYQRLLPSGWCLHWQRCRRRGRRWCRRHRSATGPGPQESLPWKWIP